MSDPDLFGNSAPQADLFADHRPGPRKIMDFQAEARLRLEKVLAEAKAAEQMPWAKRELEKWPQSVSRRQLEEYSIKGQFLNRR